MADIRQPGAVVNGSQVMVAGSNYSLDDLSSVSLIRPILTRSLGWGVAVLGLVIGVLGYIVWGTFLTPMLAGVVLLIAGLVVAMTVREHYTVRINHNSGEPVLLKFQSAAEAQRTVTEIGNAIARHRSTTQPLEREIGA